MMLVRCSVLIEGELLWMGFTGFSTQATIRSAVYSDLIAEAHPATTPSQTYTPIGVEET